MNEGMLQNYARLIIHSGANVQKGQIVLINADIESVSFTRLVVKEAYEAGASEVLVTYGDVMLDRMDYMYQSEATLQKIHNWQVEKQLDYLKEGACRIHITSPHPGALKACDPQKMAVRQKAAGEALKEVREYTMASKVQWTIAAVPNSEWATLMFPELEEDAAIKRLWKEIMQCVYVNEIEDPVKTWEQRDCYFQEHIEKLNTFAFTSLHFTNDLGTDLKVGLVDHHIWCGGSELGQNGVRFNANIPTEEVFSMPHKDRVDGIVYASRPLLYNGNLIQNFHLRFENGKVVDFDATEGKEVLASLLKMDEGSSHLGEVALVPYDSAISQSGLLFYNTLFDENASCHLALGDAYPSCIEGGLHMEEEALAEVGCNQSMNHVDFMFGTKDLRVIGERADGSQVVVFENGNFRI